MITTKNTALIGFSALLAFASTQGCGSDESTGGGAGAGIAGATAGSVGVSGGGSTAAGTGGATAGSVGVSGGGSGGAAAGSGGASAGSGGAAAGSGGAAAGSGGSGGGSAGGTSTAPKFTEVAAIINASCKGNGCHTGGEHINFTTPGANGLYGLLTTNIPSGIEHCVGSKLVDPATPANSFLPKVISANNQTCKNNGADQTVPRMPHMCSTTGNTPRPCLTAAQIKTITDWVNAGAKND